MKESLKFDFCDIEVYNNYVIVIMKEGTDIGPEHNKVLVEVTNTYFEDKPFVYISHRINSYSVDPKVYHETTKIENLKGFAVVSNDYKVKINAQIEKLFFNKSFETFSTLEEAVDWANEII